MVFVTIHAAWMILAVIIGTVAGYQGLVRATQRAGGASPLPGRFRMKSHVTLGTVYFIMVYAGLALGVVLTEVVLDDQNIMPPAIARAHIVLAVLIAVLYGAGWLIGRRLARVPARASRLAPRLHMAANFTACALIGVQIALALYYVWIWPKI